MIERRYYAASSRDGVHTCGHKHEAFADAVRCRTRPLPVVRSYSQYETTATPAPLLPALLLVAVIMGLYFFGGI